MAMFCFTDLHGRYDLFRQIQNHMISEDKCVCLGDSIDRGPEGIKILQELRKDKRFICLLGNHEEIMVDVCRDYEEGITCSLPYWYENGGEPTLEGYNKISTLGNMFAKESFLNWVSKFPKRYDYVNPNGTNFILTHSGFSPNYGKDEYLWNREHFYDEWRGNQNEIIVHGHTAAFSPEFNNHKLKAIQYCNDHKINLDLATYNTKTVALLNLDDLTLTYFVE